MPWLRVAAAGLLPAGARVAEYGSPHGGSWLGLLADRGLKPVDGLAEADVILDCFGMMHAADQAAALAERAARLAPGGVLLLQYHSLDTIIRHGQWNALRHGHYAYYSTTALAAMLAAVGFSPRTAWHFDLYGGTVLLAARRDCDEPREHPTRRSAPLLAAEARTGVRDPDVLCAGCSATSRPGPSRCTTGSPRARPPGRPCSATVRPRARSRCCARRGWTLTCCPRWRTPRPASRAADAGDQRFP